MTLEELRYKRALALVKLEVEKAQMHASFDGLRQRAGSEGMRGLLFRNVTLSRLKAADYAFLSMKVAQLAFRLWKRKRH